MPQHPESAYRLPVIEEQQFEISTGEALTLKEIEASDVTEFLKHLVGMHAVGGFGEELASKIYKPNDKVWQKKLKESIAKRQDGGLTSRRMAVRNDAGNIVNILTDGVTMRGDIDPLIHSVWRKKVRALSARLPGFHAVYTWPHDDSDGAYFRMDSATDPNYRRQGIAVQTAYFALDSIFKAQGHPLAEAPALSFVAADTDAFRLYSYPFLSALGFVETGRTKPLNDVITEMTMREMRAPSTKLVYKRLSEKRTDYSVGET